MRPFNKRDKGFRDALQFEVADGLLCHLVAPIQRYLADCLHFIASQ